MYGDNLSFFLARPQFSGFAEELSVAIQAYFEKENNLTVSISDMAAHFNISKRTLQRRLAAANMSWFQVFDDLRRYYTSQLFEKDYSIKYIARSMGYSDRSAFSNACRRWFNMTPAQIHTVVNAVREGDLPGGHWSNIQENLLNHDYKVLQKKSYLLESQLHQIRSQMSNIKEKLYILKQV